MENLLLSTCECNNTVLKSVYDFINSDNERLKHQALDLIISQMAQNEVISETILGQIKIEL